MRRCTGFDRVRAQGPDAERGTARTSPAEARGLVGAVPSLGRRSPGVAGARPVEALGAGASVLSVFSVVARRGQRGASAGRSQAADELGVGRRELECLEFAAPNPADLLAEQRTRVGSEVAPEEPEV